MSVGLINQLYGHMAAVAMASFMGAEVVLSPAQTRATFNVRQEETQWKPGVAVSTQLDVLALQQHWRMRGTIIHEVQLLLHL